MTWVVDASVVLKWVLNEEDADLAEKLFTDSSLIAPDFLMLECANVLARDVKRGRITEVYSRTAFGLLQRAGVRMVNSATYTPKAHDLAIELGSSAYDALYLAVAQAELCSLITADRRFAESANRRFPGAVTLLASRTP